MKYSAFSLVYEALRGHSGWTPAWRDPAPKPDYDVIIVGGGGHGLATAYYLAKEHGLTNVAVARKGMDRLRQCRPQHHDHPLQLPAAGNIQFYEWSMKLWEGLERTSTTMRWSASAAWSISFTPTRSATPSPAAATPCGSMASMRNCSTAVKSGRCCRFSTTTMRAFQSMGACCSGRGGTARHDAVVWGYARAADRRGVDIIQNCEVTGLVIRNGRVTGVETTRGTIRAGKVGLAVAGNSSRVAAMAGLRLPIESHVLQAFVTEGIKPLIDCVLTFGAGHFYISQSDKGGLVFGGDLDGYNSYAQRGNLPVVEDIMRGRHGALARPRAAAPPAALGRPHGHVDGRHARSSIARRSTGSISTAAGTTAASRRRRPPAGALRI